MLAGALAGCANTARPAPGGTPAALAPADTAAKWPASVAGRGSAAPAVPVAAGAKGSGVSASPGGPALAASSDSSATAVASSAPGATSESATGAAAGAVHHPAIYAATISPSVIHNGEAMTWLVKTTADVTSVTARVATYSLPLQREGPGRFGLSFIVPSNIPGFFHGTYSLALVARDDAGSTATRTVPLEFR